MEKKGRDVGMEGQNRRRSPAVRLLFFFLALFLLQLLHLRYSMRFSVVSVLCSTLVSHFLLFSCFSFDLIHGHVTLLLKRLL